ncbi:hypothetical protein GCM10009504_09230 [Pseudomonas laurentiana]|nr:hypothetical protein GCM10009504_09230 [Pseudomonas laurentiana]
MFIMLAKLFDLFSAQRAPAGYRPGVTLELLRRNLGMDSFHLLEAGHAEFDLGAAGLRVQVSERTQAQLLMHVVMTEFRLQVPASEQGEVRFDLHHTGSLKRTGIRCRYRSGDKALFEVVSKRLLGDARLNAALMPLDFKHLSIECGHNGWTVTLEHMGGSEVVNRMPAFRRYIKLSGEQKALLENTLMALQRVLLAG